MAEFGGPVFTATLVLVPVLLVGYAQLAAPYRTADFVERHDLRGFGVGGRLLTPEEVRRRDQMPARSVRRRCRLYWVLLPASLWFFWQYHGLGVHLGLLTAALGGYKLYRWRYRRRPPDRGERRTHELSGAGLVALGGLLLLLDALPPATLPPFLS